MKKLIIGAIMIALLSGCATSQKVKYSLNDISPATSEHFKSSTLLVKEFLNNRPIPEGLNTDKLGPGFIEKNGSKMFFNSDDNYKVGISKQIPKMMAEHIHKSGLFKTVTFGESNPNSDYVLEGTIKNFDSYKEYDVKTMVGQQFGLLGALATMGVESAYSVHVCLIDMKLRNSSGRVVWTDNIEVKLEGNDYADAYGWSVYIKASLALKKATEKLITEIENLQ